MKKLNKHQAVVIGEDRALATCKNLCFVFAFHHTYAKQAGIVVSPLPFYTDSECFVVEPVIHCHASLRVCSLHSTAHTRTRAHTCTCTHTRARTCTHTHKVDLYGWFNAIVKWRIGMWVSWHKVVSGKCTHIHTHILVDEAKKVPGQARLPPGQTLPRLG